MEEEVKDTDTEVEVKYWEIYFHPHATDRYVADIYAIFRTYRLQANESLFRFALSDDSYNRFVIMGRASIANSLDYEGYGVSKVIKSMTYDHTKRAYIVTTDNGKILKLRLDYMGHATRHILLR